LVGAEQWAELRREHFVRRVSIKAPARRPGLSRNTVRAALRSPQPPSYRRVPAGSKLDPFKDEIHRLLKLEPEMPGQRVRELVEALGCAGAKTIVDDYLREGRPVFAPPRTFQRTVYRPGELCQFDLWEPRREVPVGHGQTRRGWVVVGAKPPRATRKVARFSIPGSGALLGSRRHRPGSGRARVVGRRLTVRRPGLIPESHRCQASAPQRVLSVDTTLLARSDAFRARRLRRCSVRLTTCSMRTPYATVGRRVASPRLHDRTDKRLERWRRGR
jgi:hypothetical protein